MVELNRHDALLGILRGIEKESLRVTGDGELAMTPHPDPLGSALTHPNITTDFSEAQLEFITDTHSSVEDCLDQLDEIHRYTSSVLQDEYLWPLSMPCMLGLEQDIPLARYGSSNAARIKEIYREGLGNRYGRLMQTISGIHYNFSFSKQFFENYARLSDELFSQNFVNECYMNLIRNFRRHSWLLILMFGASPAVCGTFVPSNNHNLMVLDEGSYYRPNATSLRMGPLGYQSNAQSDLYVTFNSLREYLRTIRVALTEPFPPYKEIGILRDGNYAQLNDALLQIEAEFYGPIRPKRKAQSDERPFSALSQRGIEWLEVRCLDIDPSVPYGIAADTLYFVDAFLLYSLLEYSPPDSEELYKTMVWNQLTTVHDGGSLPDLQVESSETKSMYDLAQPILSSVMEVAKVLDEVYQTDGHQSATQAQIDKLEGRTDRPATEILNAMHEQDRTFSQYGIHLAKQNLTKFQANPLSAAREATYQRLAMDSISTQSEIEQSDSEPFVEYLQRYMTLPPAP